MNASALWGVAAAQVGKATSSQLAQIVNALLPSASGNPTIFVDTIRGNDLNGTRGRKTAIKTMTEALKRAEANDTIAVCAPYIQGSTGTAIHDYALAEAAGITIPYGLDGLKIVGLGDVPQCAEWGAPTASADCLTINAFNVTVQNIKFRPKSGYSGIALTASSAGTKAWHPIIRGCMFQGQSGTLNGITTDGTVANAIISDNFFYYLNTATNGHGIFGQTYTAAEPTGWKILNNFFHSNTNHIVCRLRQSFVIGNYFADYGYLAAGAGQTTKKLDISGATVGANVVTGNFFSGAFTTAGYVSGTNDTWVGNISDNAAATTVTTGDQWTTAVPTSS
jgi:hypothetical protein